MSENIENIIFIGQIIHDIRNFKPFTHDEIENINKLCYEDRMKILICYNEMIEFVTELLVDKKFWDDSKKSFIHNDGDNK